MIVRGWARAIAIATTAVVVAAFGADAGAQETRDYVNIVGPRGVYPYISAVIEEFGDQARFKFPKVETADGDVALQLLCAGAGVELPDVALINRAMTEAETARCQRNGVVEMADMKIGFDAVALIAGAGGGEGAAALTGLKSENLLLAVAAKVPDPAAKEMAAGDGDVSVPTPMIDNPYRSWREIDPGLPDLPIRFLAPPRSSLFWNIFSAGMLEVGCRRIKAFAVMEKNDPDGFRRACETLRSDEAVVIAPEAPTDLAVKLNEWSGAVAVTRLNIVAQLEGAIRSVAIDGVAPTVENVNSGAYKPAFPINLVVKQDNFEIVPGLRDFVGEFIGPRATGMTGYLTAIGMVPLTEEERRRVRALVSTLVKPKEAVEQEGTGENAPVASSARVREIEATLWEAIKESEDPRWYQTYLGIFDGGLYARVADSRASRYEAQDRDGDGIPDYRDSCPSTRKGIKVDERGCPVDGDGDGVTDDIDACAETPKGVAVDRVGCPLDGDRDGVPDHLDACADTPAGLSVDGKGCPLDGDGDGVFDERDECPDTPAGVVVDRRGCALDGDRDGVPDHLDTCADTPAGLSVDDNGCPRDGDGDGVFDERDECSDTPAGVSVDRHGCPPDGDGDGVPDFRDKCPKPQWGPVDENGCLKDADHDQVPDDRDACPDTKEKVSVDLRGCEISGQGLDADGDGVPDERDKCVGTPAGTVVDNVGCPLDRDGDGVNDAVDACPGTPKDVKVDEKGCWNIEKLYFGPADGEVQLKHAPVLDELLTVMLKNPALRIEIQGHSDAGGDPGANVWYATRRAQSVAEYLMTNGISRDRLVVRGLSSDKPAAPNDNPKNRQLNRRVEIYPIPLY